MHIEIPSTLDVCSTARRSIDGERLRLGTEVAFRYFMAGRRFQWRDLVRMQSQRQWALHLTVDQMREKERRFGQNGHITKEQYLERKRLRGGHSEETKHRQSGPMPSDEALRGQLAALRAQTDGMKERECRLSSRLRAKQKEFDALRGEKERVDRENEALRKEVEALRANGTGAAKSHKMKSGRNGAVRNGGGNAKADPFEFKWTASLPSSNDEVAEKPLSKSFAFKTAEEPQPESFVFKMAEEPQSKSFGVRKVMKCDDGSKWNRVCKAAKISLYDENSTAMVSISEANAAQTLHFKHVVPKKSSSHLRSDDNKLWCRWMTERDAIQGDRPLFLMIYFESKSGFDSFERQFVRSMT